MSIPTRTLAVMACLLATTTAGLATQASYRCDGGTQLTADFSAVGAVPAQVELLFAGQDGDLVLPQVESADGGRYADASNEFWIKGNSATLTRQGKAETCQVVPAGGN